MQRGQTHVLAFYSAFRRRERNDLYMDCLLTAVMREAGNHGFDVLTYCDFSRSPEDFYRHINGGLTDGLLFFGPYEADPLLPLLRESRLSTVLLLHEDPEERLCSVMEDMEGGIKEIASRLVNAGHRLVAGTVSPPGEVTDSQRRIALLQKALEDKGAFMPDDMVVSVADSGQGSIDPTLQALVQRSDPPTALFCWHDRIGYRILEGCDRLGIRVPEQLSLVGYDGLHWPSTSPHILTSVAVDIDAAAAAAVEMLNSQINGETPAQRRCRLPVRWEPGTTFCNAPNS
jgi:DNA-binding LacI/PurR family transcriptional regulator